MRCPRAESVCSELEPELRVVGPDHFVACHFPVTLAPPKTNGNLATTDAGREDRIDAGGA